MDGAVGKGNRKGFPEGFLALGNILDIQEFSIIHQLFGVFLYHVHPAFRYDYHGGVGAIPIVHVRFYGYRVSFRRVLGTFAPPDEQAGKDNNRNTCKDCSHQKMPFQNPTSPFPLESRISLDDTPHSPPASSDPSMDVKALHFRILGRESLLYITSIHRFHLQKCK